MFLDLSQGTFLLYWANSWAPLHGMAIALLVGTLAVFMTRWTPISVFLKTFLLTGMLATMPLGLAKMGIVIPVEYDDMVALLSFFGTVLTVGIAVSYIFHQTLRTASGKYSKSIGETLHSGTPEVAKTSDEAICRNTFDFTAGPNAGETVNLGGNTISIGRSKDNDLVLDDPTVSRHHARIAYQDGRYTIENLSGTSGTRVSGRDVSVAPIASGETVKLGNTEVGFNLGNHGPKPSQALYPNRPAIDNPTSTRVIDKPDSSMAWLAVTEGPGIGNSWQLKEGINYIGRESGKDISLDDQYISRKHAMLKVERGQVNIFDFGSTGGTKVNGVTIGAKTLQPDSVIRVGETEFKVIEVDSQRQFDLATISGKTMVDRRGEHSAVLMVTSGKDAGKSFILTEGANIVGRGVNANVCLNDDSVSRDHAVIRCYGGKLSIFDLGSMSGTSVDGQRCVGLKVNNGDVISMGRSKLTVMSRVQQLAGV